MKSDYKIHVDFVKLFLYREGKELLGKHLLNLWILVSILFFTFLAIGFGIGNLNYLSKKMDDPFVKWVDITIPSAKKDKIGEVIRELDTPELRSKFLYKNITGYYSWYVKFRDESNRTTHQVRGRTIKKENPVLKEISENKDNIIKGRSFKNQNDYGLIVTKALLIKLGYLNTDAEESIENIDVPFVNLFLNIGREERAIPLPVIAIVNNLPGKSSFAVTPCFYNMLKVPVGPNPFNVFGDGDSVERTSLRIFVAGDRKIADSLKSAIKNFLVEKGLLLINEAMSVMPYRFTYVTGYKIKIPWFNSFEECQAIFDTLEGQFGGKFDMHNIYEYKMACDPETFTGFDNISVNFNDLDSVSTFKENIESNYSQYGLKVDMAQIKALENYNYVSKLTFILSISLIFFSILSICMFISQVLKSHLNKNKMNIGTFKAFGVNDRFLKQIYLSIIFVFVSSSTAISFMLSWGFGFFGGARAIIRGAGGKLENGVSYFDLLNLETLLIIAVILFFGILVSYITTILILERTPGDLIYNRTSKPWVLFRNKNT